MPHMTATDDDRQAMTRNRDLDRRAQQGVIELVATLDDDQLTMSTPCDGWSVRDVVEHLIGNNVWIVTGVGGTAPAVADDPRVAYPATADALTSTFTDDDVLVRPFSLGGFGTFPAGIALGVHIADVVVHGWDIATATGAEFTVDDDLMSAAIEVVLGFPASAWGPGGAFARRIELPADAPAMDRLLGLCGRAPASGTPLE